VQLFGFANFFLFFFKKLSCKLFLIHVDVARKGFKQSCDYGMTCRLYLSSRIFSVCELSLSPFRPAHT